MNIFISYSKDNISFAEKLKNDLSRQDLRVISRQDIIQPGDFVPDKLIEGINKADACIIILSRRSSDDKLLQDELILAVSANLRGRLKGIIPVVTDKHVNVPYLLKETSYIDFSNKSEYQEMFQSLIKSLQILSRISPKNTKKAERRQWEYILTSKMALEAQQNELQARIYAQRLRIFSIVAMVIGILGLLAIGFISLFLGRESLRRWLLALAILYISLAIIAIAFVVRRLIIYFQQKRAAKK